PGFDIHLGFIGGVKSLAVLIIESFLQTEQFAEFFFGGSKPAHLGAQSIGGGGIAQLVFLHFLRREQAGHFSLFLLLDSSESLLVFLEEHAFAVGINLLLQLVIFALQLH